MARQKRWNDAQFDLAVRQMQGEVSKRWAPYRNLQQYLRECWGHEWEAISKCSMMGKKLVDSSDPTYFKLVPYRCNRVPFCINCVGFRHWTRVQAALEKFHRCTPAGKQPRFYHVVQTAPIGNAGQYVEGGDWGKQASEDVPWFRRVVWENVQDIHGMGVGAIASYQDFGEQAFKKRHPHLDMTLNGWMLDDDGRAVKTPRFPFAGGGRRRWDEALVKRARARNLFAEPGSIDVVGPIQGVQPYMKLLKYQLRELVDFRKIRYDSEKQLIYWKDYDSPRQTCMTTWEFADGLMEYSKRLGTWQAKRAGTVELHVGLGHMAKRSLSKTEKLVGGTVPAHGSRCVCSQCGDWSREVLTEEEEAMMRRKTRVSAA